MEVLVLSHGFSSFCCNLPTELLTRTYYIPKLHIMISVTQPMLSISLQNAKLQELFDFCKRKMNVKESAKECIMFVLFLPPLKHKA